jgi:hypothetical protein
MLTKNKFLSLDISNITHKAKSLGANVATRKVIDVMREHGIPAGKIAEIVVDLESRLKAEGIET